MSLMQLYELVTSNDKLKTNTETYRRMVEEYTDEHGEMSREHKKETRDYGNTMFPQIFPTTIFDKFARNKSIIGYTGLVHVDFDDVSENNDSLTAEDVRDMLSELDGFVMSAVSCGGDGTWAIFNAGDKVTDYHSFKVASETIERTCEELVSMRNDSGTKRPSTGRKVGHDDNCAISYDVLKGGLPEPFEWKLPRYAVADTRSLKAPTNDPELEAHEIANRERFLEIVVARSCANIIAAGDGDRHNAAIRAIANIVLCCREKSIAPLSTWGRKVREACLTCGLPRGEVSGIMQYWKQESGVSG